jgi:Peptidase_C39 like family
MINMKRIIVSLSLILLISPTLVAASTVPFTSQAPLAQWSDSKQQDGCEEASAIMAMAWVNGQTKLNKTTTRDLIIEISDFEKKEYGEYRDIYVSDVVTNIFKGWFNYNKVKVLKKVTLDQIKKELTKGNLVLTPTNGQLLKNPNFKAPGPERHMILIKSYDAKSKQFITNDPGTRNGENYRYNEAVLFKSIRAYPTGYHKKIVDTEKSVIIVEK